MIPVAIIGAGPAGLMAAEIIAGAGHAVTVYDRMPSPARKFLMAGRGGLNLTHSEDIEAFTERYGHAASWLAPVIEQFQPSDLRSWCDALGQQSFVGSSGRVFPKNLKTSPLLRAWLQRLDRLGVRFSLKRKWIGWNAGQDLLFETAEGKHETAKAGATLLALGGASWPRLGSDGGWTDILSEAGIELAPLGPANCGFTVSWSDVFRRRFEGQPLKTIALTYDGTTVRGDAMITANGIEGGAVYALSARLRDGIAAQGRAGIFLDLRPGLSSGELEQRLHAPAGSQSYTNFLRKHGGLPAIAAGLLYESRPMAEIKRLPPPELAHFIKKCPLELIAPAPLERAISTAGGIMRDALDEHFMLRAMPGVFAAGEMLDWEAPTGGYLLQATFSTAVAAARGMLDWLAASGDSHAKV
ncbi:MAG: NAD(P)/FAD-dependent oxidoreductase [Bdellovibrionales bacterium]